MTSEKRIAKRTCFMISTSVVVAKKRLKITGKRGFVNEYVCMKHKTDARASVFWWNWGELNPRLISVFDRMFAS